MQTVNGTRYKYRIHGAHSPFSWRHPRSTHYDPPSNWRWNKWSMLVGSGGQKRKKEKKGTWTKEKWKLTTMLLIVNLNSTRGLDGGALQLARSTSPGSYRSRSVHRVGCFSGSSANLKRENERRREGERKKNDRMELVNMCIHLVAATRWALFECGVWSVDDYGDYDDDDDDKWTNQKKESIKWKHNLSVEFIACRAVQHIVCTVYSVLVKGNVQL